MGLSRFQALVSRNYCEKVFLPTMSLPQPVSAISFPHDSVELVHAGSPSSAASESARATADRALDRPQASRLCTLLGSEMLPCTPEYPMDLLESNRLRSRVELCLVERHCVV